MWFSDHGYTSFYENVFAGDKIVSSEVTNRGHVRSSDMEVNEGEQPGTSGVLTSFLVYL